MAYGNFKVLTRRTASDKILCHKAVNIGKILKYDEHQHGLASRAYKLFDTEASGNGVKNENISKNNVLWS